MTKYFSFLFFFLTTLPLVFSQEKAPLYKKMKEPYEEKYFYYEIFENPAFMQGFREFQTSDIELSYKKDKKDNYLIQKPSSEKELKLNFKSYYPINPSTTVWGNAYYSNLSKQNITWNENADYAIIYPYFTANSIGGNIKKEKYAFLGGYAKKIKRITVGILIDYKASLGSRNKDPRTKNTTSNLKLKSGMVINSIYGFHTGVQLNFYKYTQSNNIKFFGELGNPPIYHLNGLGYFNPIFKGDKTNSFYDGLGYGAKLQFVKANTKDYIFTVGFNQVSIDKLIVENVVIEASKLKNRNISSTLTKIFSTSKNSFAIKLSYYNSIKRGIESILSSRSISNYKIIAKDEKYSLNAHTYLLNALYQPKWTKNKLKVNLHTSYKTYRENYSLPKSFQQFNYLNLGAKASYLYKVNTSNFISFNPFFNYNKVLSKKSLLRNDKKEVEIGKMLRVNNDILGSNFFETGFNVRFTTKINKNNFLNFGVNTVSTIYKKQNNIAFLVLTGLSF